jgi:hypothetical protein
MVRKYVARGNAIIATVKNANLATVALLIMDINVHEQRSRF